MTPEGMDAIEARAAAATPGPWVLWDDRYAPEWADPGFGYYRVTSSTPPVQRFHTDMSLDGTDDDRANRADAAFIAAARTDVPALVAALRAAEVEVERLRESSNPSDLAENLRLAAKVARVEALCDKANAMWDGMVPTGNLRAALAGGS